MNTSYMAILVVLLTTAECIAQEPQSYSKEFKTALHNGAMAKVTIEVYDGTGKPVTNANVRAFFRMSSGSSEGSLVRGLTDKRGQFITENHTTDIVFLTVENEGCYTSRKQYCAQSLDPERLKDGRWLPWNPTIPVILREIRNPIPLYATGVDFSKEFRCDSESNCDARDGFVAYR